METKLYYNLYTGYSENDSFVNSKPKKESGNMTTFELTIAIINIVAILLAPIAAVKIGQRLQDNAQNRKDKMDIFKCLMTHRVAGWANLENVNALNSIDIIFADSEPVRKQWKTLLSKYRPEFSSQERSREQCKLLELMAVDLGYKDKITWDDIQNPYYPEGLDRQIEMNAAIMNGQVEWAKAATTLLPSMMGNQTSAQVQNSNDKE